MCNTQYIVRKWIWLVLFGGLACGSPPFVVPEPGTPATDFTLKDQYDTEFRLSQFRGVNVLLVGCDKDSINLAETWLNLFRERYVDDFQIFPIITDLPFFSRLFLKSRIKSKLRGREGESRWPSIFLDWDGKVSRQYGMRSEICTVAIIDRLGMVRLIHSLGLPDEEKIQATIDMIDQQVKP